MAWSMLNWVVENRYEVEKTSHDYFKSITVLGDKESELDLLNEEEDAVEKDADLKQMAKTDLEFRNYFENDTFKTIVE